MEKGDGFKKSYRDSLPETLVFNQIAGLLVATMLTLYSELQPARAIFAICILFSNSIGLIIHFLLVAYRTLWSHLFRDQATARSLFYLVLLVLGITLGNELALVLEGPLVGRLDFPFLSREHLMLLLANLLVAGVAVAVADGYLQKKRNLERQIRENEQLKELQIRTKLAALQSKINPHFLFNTLNTVVDLVHKDPHTVERIILDLSEIYRKLLFLPETATIPLGEELELVRAYLDIEKIRMGRRLEYEISIDEPLRGFRVPPLLIEPLVENAVIHGISPKKEGGRVSVEVVAEPNRLRIVVADEGCGFNPALVGPGFGLSSVAERLRLNYRGRARLSIESRSGGGTRAIVELPHAG